MSQQLRVLFVQLPYDTVARVIGLLHAAQFKVLETHTDTDLALLEALKTNAWDLILANNPPGEFGAEAALGILTRLGCEIPLIVLTSAPSDHLAEELMGAGARDFINSGNLKRLVPVVRRELACAKLRTERIFETLFDKLPKISVQGYNGEGTICFWNKGSELIYGYTAEEALGGNLLELIIPPPMREAVRGAIREGAATGEMPPAMELELMRKGGSPVVVFSTHAVVKIPGREPVLFCIDLDITRQKAAELALKKADEQMRQAQKIETVGQLAGGIAHDFNNILAALLLNLGYLQKQPGLPDTIRSGLLEMVDDTKRASKLTQQLLLFSRRQVIKTTRVDLNETLDNLTKMLTRIIGEHIHMERSGDGTPIWVEADAGMMDQVVLNLCVNARDAMPHSGTLSLSLQRLKFSQESLANRPDQIPGAYACLCVQDTGTGMETAVQSHLFEPFFTTKEVGKGTGLGLATVHGIVKLHKGWIDVESTPGVGSTFKVYLPAAPALEEPTPPAVVPEIRRGTECIFLVEDDDTVRHMLQLSFRQQGYGVHVASSGVEALERWENIQHEVDLLFTDMVMPGGVSGLDLARKLRREKGVLKVIIASGYSLAITDTTELQNQNMHFFPKPFDSELLASKVREVLDQRMM